jgi:hypothetical protein
MMGEHRLSYADLLWERARTQFSRQEESQRPESKKTFEEDEKIKTTFEKELEE